MKRVAILAVLVFGCTGVWTAVPMSAPGPGGADDGGSFALAVLRRDGIVAPFAAFNGRRWSAPWPDSVFGQELPISLSDVPKKWWGLDTPPQTMALWRDGEQGGDVTLTGLTTMPLMCSARTLVRSDFKTSGPLPSPRERPFPKEGLLVAGRLAVVEKIRTLDKGTAEWNGTVIRVAEKFDQVENNALNVYTDWYHPVLRERRKLMPVTLEAAYAADTDSAGWRAYYVEAVRQYPPGLADKDQCGPTTFVAGWILVNTTDTRNAEFFLRGQITYCDRHRVTYMLPLGLITADAKKYWVFQSSGFAEEWYEIARPTPRRIEAHVTYNAGHCPE